MPTAQWCCTWSLFALLLFLFPSLLLTSKMAPCGTHVLFINMNMILIKTQYNEWWPYLSESVKKQSFITYCEANVYFKIFWIKSK
jgi:hypothetical protein